jgi:cytochrome P450
MVEVAVVSLEDEVQALFAGRRLTDPFPIWNRLRDEAPVFRNRDMVVLSRYADVKAMLPDRVRYSAKMHIAGSRPESIVAGFSPEVARMWREMAGYAANSLSHQEHEDHDRLRRILHRFFTPRQIRTIELVIQQFWDDLLAQAVKHEVYDHKDSSQRLALRVITHIIGCPDVDAEHVGNMVERLAYALDTSDEERVREAYDARLQLNDYIESVILAGYRRDPQSNEFVHAVMSAESDENLSVLELSSTVSELLFGGTETTAVLLSSGVLALLQHRDQWEWLCGDPVARVPTAVEELFRYVSPTQWVPRTAGVDFELEGVEVPEGCTVVGSLGAAHRDPAQYGNPDTLDITRSRPHLGLGLGPKFCLGASVVRAEARIALTSLAQRYPDMELAIDPSGLDWSGGPPTVRSVRSLPIALGRPRW